MIFAKKRYHVAPSDFNFSLLCAHGLRRHRQISSGFGASPRLEHVYSFMSGASAQTAGKSSFELSLIILVK